MKYSNELKVGISIIVAGAIFVLGIRFFEDLPLFGTTYQLETELDNAAGLIPGNVVRVNGVSVGSVDEVFINPDNNRVRVKFHVDSTVPIKEGTESIVSGFDALGVVRMDLILGPVTGDAIPNGGFLPSKAQTDLLGDLTDRAPVLLEQVDDVMNNLDSVLLATRSQLDDPASDVRQMLVSVRTTVGTLDQVLRAERARLSSVLANVDTVTGSLARSVGNGDSLAAAISDVRRVMERLDGAVTTLDGTLVGLNTLLDKVNSGQGTLGLMVNDPGLYHRADSLMTSLEALLVDFKTSPGKYLKEMRIIDLF